MKLIEYIEYYMEKLYVLFKKCSRAFIFWFSGQIFGSQMLQKYIWRASTATAQYSFRLRFKKRKKENKKLTTTPAIQQNLT